LVVLKVFLMADSRAVWWAVKKVSRRAASRVLQRVDQMVSRRAAP
jgi:hypothetical protein